MHSIPGVNDLQREKTPTVLLPEMENASGKESQEARQDCLAVEQGVSVPLHIHKNPARVAIVREERISVQDLVNEIVPSITPVRPQHLQGGCSQQSKCH